MLYCFCDHALELEISMTYIQPIACSRYAIFWGLLCALLFCSLSPADARKWRQDKPTPKLHVKGRFLQDPNGRSVTLHGWWQPIDGYFNNQNYKDPSDWTNAAQVASVLHYQSGIADILTHQAPLYNANHGWGCRFVRPTGYRCPGWDYSSGLLADPAQFNAYLKNFVVPYINHCRQKGLYVVLVGNPTGQDQGANYGDNSHNMTQQYQQSLLQFWQIVSIFPGIKSADNVQFELCNEPNCIETQFGNGQWGNGDDAHYAALARFMQPIVNVIHTQKADNIIWVPSLADQQQNNGFIKYPIRRNNIGYAAHIYPGYVSGANHNGDANLTASVTGLWNYEYKDCADRYPMIITESWWTSHTPEQLKQVPYLSLFDGITGDRHYGYGAALKKNLDSAGNISYVIGTSQDLLANTDLNLIHVGRSDAQGASAAFDWFFDYSSHHAASPPPVQTK